MVYEGAEAKRFLPFWWSPVTALSDMQEPGVAFVNGEIVKTEPFSDPVRRSFPELNGLEVEMVEHAHDEPVYMGINSKKYFKGVKNVYFKYGGTGIAFARPLYRAGLLSKEEIVINGRNVVPFEVILSHIPPAPKSKDEIKEILDEGLIADFGAFVVEAYGEKDGKKVLADVHVSSPDLVEAFEKSGLTAEMYLTGQCGFIYTRMLVNGKIDQRGLISSDMLTDEQVDYYLDNASKLGIDYTIKTTFLD